MVAKSKDAEICERFLRGCLSSTRTLCGLIDENAGERLQDDLTYLTVTLGKCNSVLSRAFGPVVMGVLLEDTEFQSWTLVLFELLNLLKWKFENSILHNTLELCVHGPRLGLFFERIGAKIAAHVAIVEPHLSFSGGVDLASNLRKDLVLKVDHLLEDVQGREWWVESFGNNTYAVPWESFFDKLSNHSDPKISRYFSDSAGFSGNSSGSSSSSPTSFREKLQKALSPQQRRAVTAFQWAEFLVSFGPGIRVALIQLYAPGVSSCSWFAGALSYDEARSVLTPCVPGTFLVRFSESATCTWAVSYCDIGSGLVKHALIQANSSKEKKVENHFISGNQRYSSLRELIDKNSARLKHPARNVKHLGPARFFRDFLSHEETRDMLEGQPTGTFLVRFSMSEECTLVIANVLENGKVSQSKIYCDSEKGFLLEGHTRYYDRMSTLVKRNKSKLKFPLAVAFRECSVEEEDRFDEIKLAARSQRSAIVQKVDHQVASMYGQLPTDDFNVASSDPSFLASSYMALDGTSIDSTPVEQNYGLAYASLGTASEFTVQTPVLTSYRELDGQVDLLNGGGGIYGAVPYDGSTFN